MRRILPFIAAAAAGWLCAGLAGCGSSTETPRGGETRATRGRVPVTEAAPDTGSDPMIVALVNAFASRDPDARRVSIVEFRRVAGGGDGNLVLARGATPAGTGPGDWFGVFVFDDSLKRILRTVAMVPAPRPGDTQMRFERTTPDSVFLLGWATASGETLLTGGYRWRSAANSP